MTRLLSPSRLVISLASAIFLACVVSVAQAAHHPIEVDLAKTGQTIAVPVGQELVVSLPLLQFRDDHWYVAENSGGNLKLIGRPVEKRPRNWTPWGYSRQEFHFRRNSPGSVHLVFERTYYSKPMVLDVVDATPSH